jgi:hypothetical protein
MLYIQETEWAPQTAICLLLDTVSDGLPDNI